MKKISLLEIRKNFEGSLVIFSAALVAIILLIVCFFFYLADAQKHKIKNSLEAESTRLEAVLLDRFESTFAIIKSINLQISKRPNDVNYINEILQKFRTTPELSENFSWTIFSWANSKNLITVDAQYGVMEKPFNLSSRDYISLTKQSPGELFLGNPVFGSTSKKWMIPGGVGLANANGKYLGATTIGFEIESLKNSLQKTISDNYIRFELVNNDRALFSQITEISEIVATLKNSQTGSTLSISLLHNPHGFLIKKLDHLPYFLILQYDSTAIRHNFWLSIASRSLEIFLMFTISSLLLFIIYKREKQQREKIIALKNIIQNTNEARSEFVLHASNQFKNFIFTINGNAEIIKKHLRQIIETNENSALNEILETDFSLSCDIAKASAELADFITNMIDLHEAESIKFNVGEDNHHGDISKIVGQSIKLLQKIAVNPNVILTEKIEENLYQLSQIDPKKVKQIIINLMPETSKNTRVEVLFKK